MMGENPFDKPTNSDKDEWIPSYVGEEKPEETPSIPIQRFVEYIAGDDPPDDDPAAIEKGIWSDETGDYVHNGNSWERTNLAPEIEVVDSEITWQTSPGLSIPGFKFDFKRNRSEVLQGIGVGIFAKGYADYFWSGKPKFNPIGVVLMGVFAGNADAHRQLNEYYRQYPSIAQEHKERMMTYDEISEMRRRAGAVFFFE